MNFRQGVFSATQEARGHKKGGRAGDNNSSGPPALQGLAIRWPASPTGYDGETTHRNAWLLPLSEFWRVPSSRIVSAPVPPLTSERERSPVHSPPPPLSEGGAPMVTPGFWRKASSSAAVGRRALASPAQVSEAASELPFKCLSAWSRRLPRWSALGESCRR
jgi:hypothetical protein